MQYYDPNEIQGDGQYLYPQPGNKKKKSAGKHTNNGSMILQMSNLMNKRNKK